MAATDESVSDNMKHCYENLILIDAGANLTNKKYSRDLDAVVQRAQDSGQCKSCSVQFECQQSIGTNRQSSMTTRLIKPIVIVAYLITNYDIQHIAWFVINDIWAAIFQLAQSWSFRFYAFDRGSGISTSFSSFG